MRKMLILTATNAAAEYNVIFYAHPNTYIYTTYSPTVSVRLCCVYWCVCKYILFK